MTYCCGILVREGIVLVADTRTNAGLDNIATFRKLHIFENPGERVLLLATAGNLSVTQGVVNFLSEGFENPDTGEVENAMSASTMLQAAQLVGRAVRRARTEAYNSAEQSTGVSFDVSLLVGGQIAGGAPRLFMVYTAGNCIECTPDTNYLQIGEHKYGKPVLDRAITFDVGLDDCLKVGLVSMDSTMRSNLGVGLPIDVLIVRPDALEPELKYRIEAGEPYFHDLRARWSAALRAAQQSIPRPPYLDQGGKTDLS